MTSRLSIYNGALTVHLGDTPLETLDDDVPARYALDDVWDRDGIKRCLQQGQWNHAIRSARLDYEPSITPSFGYRYAFAKPDDFVRTAGVCLDEYFNSPLKNYNDEARYWWADVEELFVRFVSLGDLYGMDLANWPADFTAFVEAWFALQITGMATYSDKKDDMEATVKRLLLAAKSTDAMEQPSKRNPQGSWSSSRGGRGDGERGSRGRFTG